MRRITIILCVVLVICTCFALFGTVLAQTTQSKIILPPSAVVKLKPLVQKNLMFLTDSKTNNVTYLSKADDKIYLQIANFDSSVAAGKQFLKEYAKYFGSTDYSKELKLQKQSLDWSGTTNLIYQQYYKNIPVFGGQILVHVAGDFGIKSASGKFLPKVAVNTKSVLNKTKAIAAAIKDGQKRGLQAPHADSAELTIYNKRVLYPKAANNFSLVWQVELADATGWREALFVDARNGKIVEKFDRVKTVDFQMNNLGNFTNTNDLLYALYGGNTLQRRVYDCRPDGCTASSTAAGLVITDPANMRSEGDVVYGAADVDSLYDDFERAHSYYKDVHGLNGGNSLGGIGVAGSERYPATSTIGYTYFIATSTWGSCPNAWGGKRALKFCDGIVNTAIVGHEYTHAVSDFIGPPTTSLVYRNESGAIEEAVADIMSQGVERYALGASSWKIGPAGDLWRNFADPLDPDTGIKYPKTHYDTNYWCAAGDKGGVHYNSMVLAHMAYLLTTGGNTNGCDIEAVDQEKIEKMFFEALDNHLTVTADFQELYGALTDSCKELYGLGSKECVNLIKAMQAAELDQPGSCSLKKSYQPLCAKTLGNVNEYIWRSDNLKDFRFKRLIETNPVVDPNPFGDMVGSPDVGASSGSVGETNNEPINSVTTDNINTNQMTQTTTATTSTPIVEEVREPSFTVDVIQNNKYVTVNGKLNYYGKGAKCFGPRYYDPIVVRWVQHLDTPTLKSDNTFTASHEYDVKNKTYELSVSVYNSCFGMTSFHKTLNF